MLLFAFLVIGVTISDAQLFPNSDILTESPPPQSYSSLSSSVSSPTTISSKVFASYIGQFSNSLYQAVLPMCSGNIIISPFSVQTAMSLLFVGAGGKTVNILQKGLNLGNLTQQQTAIDFRAVLTPYQGSNDVQIANAIYVMQGFRINSTYRNIVTQDFYSIIRALNFANNKASANTINQWVEQETHDKIKNLVSADSLGASTRLVLVNAIYFNGTWLNKFTPISDSAFYPAGICDSSASSIEQTKMMRVKAKFNYVNNNDLDATILELPYTESGLSMVIVLPNDCNGLDNLQTALSTYDLEQLSEGMGEREVIATIPKFKIETSLTLNTPLTNMGMGKIFTPAANFNNILQFDSSSSQETLDVSQVVHKAYIDVNENGTVAAAATAVIVTRALVMRRPPPPVIFTADHPFMYFIKSNNDILFMGRLVNNK